MCDRLIAEGHEVVCLDNLLTGSLENIQHLLHHPRFTFIPHDVTAPIDLDARRSRCALLDADEPLDFVLHFASPASPRAYAQHPIHTLKVGALGTHHALGLARARGAVFVLASSSEVYGDPQVNPQSEAYWGNVNPVGPRSVYDEAKRYAEAMAAAYCRAHGLRVRIARIFNTYGPRMRLDDGRVLPNFITQALRNHPLTLYGNGSQTRSFCYVEDLIEGLWRLMFVAPRSAPGGGGDCVVVNLGSPEGITILDLAHEVIELTGSTAAITQQALPPDDPQVRRPDITRAQNLLDWSPRIARREGLLRVIAYFRDQLIHPMPASSSWRLSLSSSPKGTNFAPGNRVRK
jgi:dTDP-glucose 4,6-dehydratase